MAGKAASSLGGKVMDAATMPMFSYRIQPGKYKGTKDKRRYVPDPRYPDGVTISIPAWIVALIGMPLFLLTMGYIANMLGGGKTSKKDRGLISETWGSVAKLGSPGALIFEGLTGKDLFGDVFKL